MKPNSHDIGESIAAVPSDLDADAIDLRQWQLEIDSFIDETASELNEIARMLDGGPIDMLSRPAATASTQKTNQTSPASTVPRDTPNPGDSTDRLASLKQKLASQIEESKRSH